MAQPTNQRLVLVAMIFAVAMTFIDQTIVAIAVPELQKDLSLSATGVQWVVNGYLLSLSALFAFGGRLADIAGHRRMVVIGVIGFAGASALCGATPTGDLAEAWIISWRVVQGAFAALMFPAALAIVVGAFPVSERGKAMAIFFAVTGGLTSVGPLAGGYLTAIDWRAIFWVNIPVAIIALVLTARAKPADDRHPAPLDFRGAVLISGGMGLVVLGLQQSSTWGWGDPATWGCIARRPGPARRIRGLRVARGRPADTGADLRRPRLRRRQRRPVPHFDGLRAALLLRQPVRTAFAWAERLGDRPVSADLLRRALPARPSSEGASSTAAAHVPPSFRAVCWRRSASRSGPGGCPTRI